MENDVYTVIIFAVFILGGLMWATYDTIRTQALRPSAVIVPFCMGSLILMCDFGVFAMPLKGRGFMTATGIKGTLVSAPRGIDNDRMKYRVAFGKHYVSSEVKERTDGATYWILDLFRGTVTIDIIDRATRFRELAPNNCEDPKGCIVYDGSINGLAIEDYKAIAQKEIDSLRYMVNKQNTIYRTMLRDVEILSQNENKDVAKMAQRLKSMTRDLGANQTFSNNGVDSNVK